jgi:glyoxylase-like metal-dependent hydrolase (beta-lactamase superfamily II)
LKAAFGAAGVVIAAPVLRQGWAFGQATTAPNTIKLADNLFILQLPGEENVIAQTDSRGTLLVDGGSAKGSESLLAAVAALPNAGNVHTLFNTHWHPEQTGSNERLAKAGATIISHENTRLWEQQNVTWPWGGTVKKLAKAAQPTKTFYDKGQLDSGVRYGWISDAAHTDGDLYVHFPTQNVLAVGGAVYGQGWAELDWWSGGWIGGVCGALQRLQTVADANTKIVPARGPVLSLADLRTQLEMYSTIYDRLSQLLNRGRSPKEAVEAKVAKDWEEKLGNSDAFVNRAFESLWAYVSPDA